MLESTIEQTIVDEPHHRVRNLCLQLVENPAVLEEIVAEFNASK